MDWMIRVQSTVGVFGLSLGHNVLDTSGAHPASYPKGNEDAFPRSKVVEA
jgi:hypothetical protein